MRIYLSQYYDIEINSFQNLNSRISLNLYGTILKLTLEYDRIDIGNYLQIDIFLLKTSKSKP